MAIWHRLSWASAPGTSRKERRTARKQRLLEQIFRKPRIEQFEPRQMLAVSPTLVSIIPNAGDLLNLNGTEVRNQEFRELTFRFDEGQRIDEVSARNGGIQIIRAGGDGIFGNGNEVNITPNVAAKNGFVGLGDRPNEIVIRFSDHLPDDLYQIRIVGSGAGALRNVEQMPFNNGQNRSVGFELDLGPQIIAVVPQPIHRVSGQLQQARNEIEVYFNNDDLSQTAATNPAFYQLIRTGRTADNLDDGAAILPTSVVYDPIADKVRLIFSSDIASLNTSESVYRLRVGNRYTAPLPPVVVNPAQESGDMFATASNANNAAALGTRTIILQGEIKQVSPYGLELPGSNDEPGHRDIPARDFPLTEVRRGVDTPHVEETDTHDGTETFYYSFKTIYGADPQSNPLTNLMSPTQKQRAREAFEYYAKYLGVQFIEVNEGFSTAPQGSELFVVALGDLRAVDPSTNTGPGNALVLSSRERNLTVVDNAENWGDSEPGGAYFRAVMQGVGQLLGMGHAFDLPATTIMGDTQLTTPDAAFPGDHDIVHGRHTHRPESTDIDVFRFTVNQAGVFSAEIAAERLVHSSLLDSVLWVYSSTGELIARNDDYFSEDSYVELELQPGDYYVAVTSTGMAEINPKISNSGFGGTTEGDYELRLNFEASPERTPTAASGLVDVDGQATLLDGDADGKPGGEYNFWLTVASAANTFVVDKSAPAGGNGSLSNPFNNIPSAFAAATARNSDASSTNDVRVVRIVGNGGADGNSATLADNLAYEIGVNSLGQSLSDGTEMQVPKGMTVMIDAGAVFKLRRANIDVGSKSQAVDRSEGHLQVLGTPTQSVFFTSYHNETLGRDTFSLPTTPAAGDWGGIVFRNELDYDARRSVLENEGIFLSYVNHANFGFGGGDVVVAGVQGSFSPIHLNEARPTVSFNTITNSAGAAIGADPNSFKDNLINDVGRGDVSLAEQRRFTADYSRIGPEVHFNRLLDNTINGLFIAVNTAAGQVLDRLEVSARFNDTDIVHVLAEHLIIQGTPGGAVMYPGIVGRPDQPTYAQGSVAITGGVATLTSGAWPSWVRSGALLTVGTLTYTVASRDSGGTQLTLTDPSVAILGNRPFILVGRPSQQDARLRIDPGIVVKLDSARIEAEIGSQLIAEGLANNRVVFTSLLDDRFGASGTFDTAGHDLPPFTQGTITSLNGVVTLSGGIWPNWAAGADLVVNGATYTVATRDSDTQVTLVQRTIDFPASQFVLSKIDVAEPGDWGGLYFGPVSSGSLDHTLITYAGGVTPVEGGFGSFNAVEIQQAEVRLTNSVLEKNADGSQAGRNNQRFGNDEATIFVRGAQPVIVGNTLRDNAGAAVSTSVNALNSDLIRDWGRSTGGLGRTGDFLGNFGPLVRNNRLGGNEVNGMVVRGGELTTQSVWDDTDIVHVVDGEVVVPNHHTFSGLRLQSSATESLVVKVRGLSSGITAAGSPLDIDDRIGGTVQIIGTPGRPVVLTSALDSTVGAGFDPEGRPQRETIAGAKPPASAASQLNIDYRMSPLLATNTALVSALNVAAAMWESVLDDPINVVIDVSLAALAGPAGVATPIIETRSYDVVRQLMIADAGPNEDIVSQLPTFAQLQALLPDQTYVVTPSMEVARANLRALGVASSQLTSRPSAFDPLTLIDGTLQFETTATFDFDPSDGITPGSIDFVAVAALEIGHALGFLSAVDDVDAGSRSVNLFPLDLFRLEPGAGATDFTNSPRVLDPAVPLHVFYDGGIYNAAGVTAAPLTIGDIPLSTGTVNGDGFQASHWKDESLLGVAQEIGVMDPQITTGIRNRVTAADSRAFDLMGYNAVSRGTSGDWRSIRLDQYSNDRNAAVITEREPRAAANDAAQSAQPLGELAPNERSGDENRRLALEVHGAVASEGDVDVYSFAARAGTEVWLDIDRTSAALDSVLELIDANGNVLARSNDSALADQTSAGGQVRVFPMQRDIFEGRDLYTTNPHDAGMRLILPGPSGSQQTYYVRVRSNVGPGDSLDDPGDLHRGQSRGGYQLQLRLRELDEIPGSTVQYADIRYAANGIEILGMPGHSPLLGESAETTVSNETRAEAQDLGNVLTVDRGAISVAGSLTDYNDVDWYQFVVDWDRIDDYPDGTGIRHDDFTSVIFDVDFADGAGRPDTTLALFDETGTLIYISRDSGISDDQVAPGLTSDLGDLSRGSFGPNDPFLGPVMLRENAGQTYFLAVMSDALLPDALRNDPLARVEPILAQDRLVDDRVGGGSWFPFYANELRDTPGLFFDPIQTFGDEWHLGDVAMFIHDGARLWTVDPYTGGLDADYGPRRGFANAGYGDLAMRTDGRLLGMALGGQEGERGATVEIDDGTNAQTTVGDDGVQGGPIYHAFTVIDAGNDERISYAVSATNQFYAFNADTGTTDDDLTGFDNDPPKTLVTLDPAAPPGETWYLDFTDLVTGLAVVQGEIYGVTETGILFSLDPTAPPPDNLPDPPPDPAPEYALVTVIATLGAPDPLDPEVIIPFPFSGLSRGPTNVESGVYSTLLFATDSTGGLHAFDTEGVMQNVFAGGVTSVSTGLIGATGLAFSSLDMNLWHTTDRRGQDEGRGIYPTPDGVRGDVHVQGGLGWHFGLEEDKGQIAWQNYATNPALFDTYDLPGGSHGTLTTNPISLVGQSFNDAPTLYFNYFSQHDSDATDDPNNSALDSFRVHVSTDGANWTLVAQTPVPERFPETVARTGMQNDTGGWRQALVDLSDFAGQDNVRVRFDFNTSGSRDIGLPQFGGEILGIKTGDRLVDGDSFVINHVVAGPTTFEFDTGFNLVVPALGAQQIADGETFTIDDGDGPITFEFDTAGDDVAAGNTPVTFAPNANAGAIAQAIAAAITGAAPPTIVPHVSAATITLEGVTSVVQASPAGTPSLLVTGDAPGTVVMDAVPVPIHAAMTADEVAVAIATAMDNHFIVTVADGVDDPAIFSTTKVDRDALYVMAPVTALGFPTLSVFDPGPLAYSNFLPGDLPLQGADQARNNVFEGVILDDFILAAGERGEVVSNVENGRDLIPPELRRPIGQVLEGAYQVEIRRGIDYGFPLFDVDDDGTILFGLQLTRGFDSNDRSADSTNVTLPPPSAIGPGSTFTVDDGTNTVTFEYDVSGSGIVTPGRVRVDVSTAVTAIDVARITGQAINDHAVLSSVATWHAGVDILGEQFGSPSIELVGVVHFSSTLLPIRIDKQVGTTIDLTVLDPNLIPEGTTIAINDGQRRILFELDRDFISDLPTRGVLPMTELVNISAATTAEEVAFALAQAINFFDIRNLPGGIAPGTLLFPISTLVTAEHTPGTASLRLRDAVDFAVLTPGGMSTTVVTAKFGDSNPVRDQGQIVIHSNTVSNSEGFGIRYDAGPRDANGSLPHPGAVRNLNEFNSARVVRGVVISNNTIAGNATGGILVSGDPAADPQAPIPLVRVYNNTIYGGPTPSGVGIRVNENSSPTLLNNVVSSLVTGIEVDASSSSTVVGATVYHGNTTNTVGVGMGTFPITVSSSEALFVDPAHGNFYPITGSRVIDSSADSLQERPELANVMTAIGYSTSPLLAPERDQMGQMRVNDPSVPSPPGLGGDVFKDRGAVERADFTGPTAALVDPVSKNVLDASVTTLPVLETAPVLEFAIQLIDGVQPAEPEFGSGIDDTTVVNGRVRVNNVEVPVSRVRLFRDGVMLVENVDYLFSYDATNNVIHLRPTAGIWTAGHLYVIRLDNSALTGIRDLAANVLKANNLLGTTEFNITIDPVDFGDAPPQYPTQFADDGAHHRIVAGLHLGATVTAEVNGQPSQNALSDNGDDGVQLPANFVVGEARDITVTASAAGQLDAWIDFNRDGDWDDAGEQIVASQALAAGANTISITAPDGTAFGESYARFRFSTAGGLGPTGPANDGEVEDYRVQIEPLVSYTLQLNYTNGSEMYRDLLNRYFVSPGLQLIAEVYVDDNRGLGAGGVRQAFADLMYDNDMIDFDPASLEFGATFTSGRTGTVDDAAPTQVEEAGGIAPVAPANAERQLLFRVRGTVKTDALAEQTFNMSLNQADVSPAHDTQLFNNAQPVQASYETEQVVVKANAWQNAAHPLDVNHNGFITGLDALIIINRLNLQGPAVLPPPGESIPTDNPPVPMYPAPFLDVNGDGRVTAIDALTVINALNLGGGGAVITAAGDTDAAGSIAAAPLLIAAGDESTSIAATTTFALSSTNDGAPLASSLDVTPVAISVASSGSTAVAPMLVAAETRARASASAIQSAIVDLFNNEDDGEASVREVHAPPPAEALAEVLADDDPWYDNASYNHDSPVVAAPRDEGRELEAMLEALGLEPLGKNTKASF